MVICHPLLDVQVFSREDLVDATLVVHQKEPWLKDLQLRQGLGVQNRADEQHSRSASLPT